jgi:hypothetical protein
MRSTLVIVIAGVFMAGCSLVKDKVDVAELQKKAIDKAAEELKERLDGLLKTKGEAKEDEAAFVDDLTNLAPVVWHGIDVRGWKVTHDLIATWHGGGVYLNNSAVNEWPVTEANVGSVWVIGRQEDGKLHGWRYDQIRRGQQTREFPHYPPREGHGSYRTIRKEHLGEVYISISTMARSGSKSVDPVTGEHMKHRTKFARVK